MGGDYPRASQRAVKARAFFVIPKRGLHTALYAGAPATARFHGGHCGKKRITFRFDDDYSPPGSFGARGSVEDRARPLPGAA